MELEEARSAAEAIDKKAEHASDEALKVSDRVIKMLDESSEAIALGEMSRYRELQPGDPRDASRVQPLLQSLK